MRGLVCLFAGLLVSSALGAQQNSYCSSVNKIGDQVTLTAESWDPVLSIGRTLAGRYGIKVSIEAPHWDFPADTEDVAVADPAFSAQHGNVHYRVMKRHLIQVRFSTSPNGSPLDESGLLRQLADAANRQMPYSYRLDIRGNDYAMVPTRTRNSRGGLEDVPPLLDRHVSIPAGTRLIAEHAKLMADQLSQQTGYHVSCCQSFVFGVAWGLEKVAFEAQDRPAREVLQSLIRMEQKANSESSRHSDFDH